MEKPKIICIVGPTASGKSSLAISLAQKIDAEIISADSMQIYKNLNIGTAKVTLEEMHGIKHHLIDICDIYQNYSVADYKKACYNTIDEILNRKKNVIIAGGTGLYISAIVKNMNFENRKIDLEYRKKLYDLAAENGNEYLYNILKNLDYNSALNIHPNNLKRVIRAIEYAKLYNKNKSEHMKEEKNKSNVDIPYEFYIFGIDVKRDLLYQIICKRIDLMLEQGLVKEAKYVYDAKLPKGATCMQAIGYKEFFDYFTGKATLDECIEKLKTNTKHYAKRQYTWFKNMSNVEWLDFELSDIQKCNKILERLNEKQR